MKYLLDTHVALRWLYEGRKLDKDHGRILDRIERAGDSVGMSAISLWEVAKLIELDRLGFAVAADELLSTLETVTTVMPLTARIAFESSRLGGKIHRDPADQLIVATARCHGLTLLTSDRKLIDSGLVSVA
jgi:PIN domain nuclease of toxin-antitoxin system